MRAISVAIVPDRFLVEFLCRNNEANVLARLDDADLILPTLRLHGDHIVATALIEPDIEFVDLDLPNPFDGRAKMVLKAVGRKAEKGVDQPVVAHDGQKRRSSSSA